jgi:hypothetical protein
MLTIFSIQPCRVRYWTKDCQSLRISGEFDVEDDYYGTGFYQGEELDKTFFTSRFNQGDEADYSCEEEFVPIPALINFFKVLQNLSIHL